MRLVPFLCTAIACTTLVACIDPADRRPGLWLSGDVATGDVDDWSFANEHPEIFVETRTPYWIPHSTTIACAADGPTFYVAARNPTDKRWVDNILRDPNVRIEIADTLYERRLVRLDDAADQQAAYRAYSAKYGWPASPAADAPEVWYFRVVPRS